MKSVDIIVPVHNPSKEFKTSINSLLNQCYENIRIIIIDDSSSFGHDFLDSFAEHEKVEILKTDQNRGGGYARNLGLRFCTAFYIAFCDSDDVWPSDKLKKQITLMEEKDYVMTHTDMVALDGDKSRARVLSSTDRVGLEDFLRSTNLYCSTVCIKASILGGHRFSELRIRHPFKFWVSILSSGVVSHRVPDLQVSYLVRAGSVSSRPLLTLAHTIYAYLAYPKDKKLALKCLFRRIMKARSGNSRIFNGLFK
jgi:glycosyltransferase involved in cell wall biosynthesis